MATPDPVSEAPVVVRWKVYSADRHLVATYDTEAAAAAHVACWPAMYYVSGT